MFLQRLSLVCVIAVAAAIALVAGPRIMAGLELAESQDTLRRIRGSEQVNYGAIFEAIDTRRAAAARDPGPRAQAELGELLLTLAALDDPRAQELRPQLAEEAMAATRAALVKSPTQPFAWTRYTQALALKTELERAQGAAQAGTVAAVDGPLSMAIVTGPWQASLVPTRVEMGLYFWYRLSDFTRRLVAGQIFIAARQDPVALAAVTRRQNALREVMAILLAEDDLLQEFTRTYYYTQSIDAEQRGLGQQQGQ
ncbi:MAG: hypothetical protein R3F55_10535 [Alphaproteobacteria bacterium]